MRESIPTFPHRARVALAAGALVLCAAAPSPASAEAVTETLSYTGATETRTVPAKVPSPETVTETFSYTGAAQTWTVPANVTSATFDVYGAAGGAFSNATPSRGGRATATISVTPGASIEVYVGGQGRDGQGTGGFNGGGTVGRMTGGGASDVRIGGTTLADRAVVAGGGGGGTSNCTSPTTPAGAGGGLTGGAGLYNPTCVSLFGAQPGTGGTQSEGGTNPGSADASGTLGSGGPAVGDGGGGGGGYYGGAGGFNTGGGGGGSGFGPAGTQFETGTHPGDGLVEITYSPGRTITVSTTGAGTGTITGDGLDCGGAGHTTCEIEVTNGDQITLTATAAANSDFAGFTGAGCSTSPCTFTATADTSVSAAFSLQQFGLSVTKDGSGSGSVTSSPARIDCGIACTAPFTFGTSVTLTASPAANSDFAGFTGAGCSTSPCTFTVTADTSVSAAFSLQQFGLSVTKDGSGSGSVTSSPAGIDCGITCTAPFTFGTSVTLTALPAPGSAFNGWSEAGCTGTGACTVAMTQARSVQATFRLTNTDTDGDGLSDDAEVDIYQTDPLKKDTDGDRLTDGQEVKGVKIRERFEICGERSRGSITVRTNPLSKDTDKDGLSDGKEVKGYKIKQRVNTRTGSFIIGKTRSNPTETDTDRDGLKDEVEVTGRANKRFGKAKSDPTKCDTDHGGSSDGAEIQARSNPADVRSGPGRPLGRVSGG